MMMRPSTALESDRERNALVLKNLGLFRIFSRPRSGAVDGSTLYDRDDAMQDACLQGTIAAGLYDASRDRAYGTYAKRFVRVRVAEGRARMNHPVIIPDNLAREVRAYRRVRQRVVAGGVRNPSFDEVYRAMYIDVDGGPPDDADRLRLAIEATDREAIPADQSGAPADAEDPSEVAARNEEYAILRAAWETLPPRRARAIQLSRGLFGESEHSTSQVAAIMGCTQQRAQELCSLAIDGLRRALMARGIKE